MQLFVSTIALALLGRFASAAAVAPVEEIVKKGDSGCYIYEDPDCCINYGVCECQDGHFYQVNQANGGYNCQPPWGYLASSVSGLPGACC
ncbi:hypothetical protein JX265_006779 [Neoarthrinium moseri]|uniref:Uncharacterized protein n=1 Tax=Neoarthrinium moseri TaxID=1658444 RepID=A0A9P9WKV6_9PEZI|nr:uncharacterized protein JN550_002746 [Neoarthrinium moseri]KAI1847025.1 hypothetical protein JX266_006900 [Neoarthrinium moseri]KAI1868800.1 hypothetical protein JX265_006779 [Neoarthrinium moseri]KAI1874167.1 hypothetical protein JN550_002746 [Neoarthrinium moseri]